MKKKKKIVESFNLFLTWTHYFLSPHVSTEYASRSSTSPALSCVWTRRSTLTSPWSLHSAVVAPGVLRGRTCVRPRLRPVVLHPRKMKSKRCARSEHRWPFVSSRLKNVWSKATWETQYIFMYNKFSWALCWIYIWNGRSVIVEKLMFVVLIIKKVYQYS